MKSLRWRAIAKARKKLNRNKKTSNKIVGFDLGNSYIKML